MAKAKKTPGQSYVRKIGKIGSVKNHSYYVTLPVDFVRGLNWREGQRLSIKRVGIKLHITDWKP
jgi:hypothetical protein